MEKRSQLKPQSLQEALGAFTTDAAARFHMPGHKGVGMAEFWRDELVRWDVTELSRTDNLHAPKGAIACAQNEMAKAYNAKASFYVVNGSTNAVQAMILALGDGEKLLLARDCHRSAVYGAALRGVETAFLTPEPNEQADLPGMVTPDLLDRALNETRATAVLVTSPNAYGFCPDIAGLAGVAHRHGALLMVDGAHGAHFPFSDALPTPLGGVADLFAHSQHKTMDALTQAASLHLCDCRISQAQLQRALAMTETSSPSYLIMASLDWSIYMAKRRNWTKHAARCEALRTRIDAPDGLCTLNLGDAPGAAEQDRTRIVIDVTGRGISGYQAMARLEESGIFIEMADERRITLITSPNDEPAWYDRLLESLDELPQAKPDTAAALRMPKIEQNESRLSIRAATFANSARIPLQSATGRIATEPIGVYPPGIALVMPGETIQREMAAYLSAREALGGALFGVHDGMVDVVRDAV